MTNSLEGPYSLKTVKNYTYLLGAASNHVPDYKEIAVVINEYQVNFPFEAKKCQPSLDQGCPGMGCGCKGSIGLHLGPTSLHALHLNTKDSMVPCI